MSRERGVSGCGALVAHGLPHKLRVFEYLALIMHEFRSLLLLDLNAPRQLGIIGEHPRLWCAARNFVKFILAAEKEENIE